MKIFKRIVAVLAIVLGLIFLMEVKGDIQLGFGAVLLVVGLLAI